VSAKSVALPSLENAPQMIPLSNIKRNQEKYVPYLPLNWVGGEYLNSPWMGQIDSLNLLRSCALTLYKCALAVGPYVTATEE
jgi:hypothetical protein